MHTFFISQQNPFPAPHYLHFEMIKKALAAGKDVVAEKPLVRTRLEWEELLSTGQTKITRVLFYTFVVL